MAEEGTSSTSREAARRRGPLRWMAENRVAANLLMALLLVGGLLSLRDVTQEVFPETVRNAVTINVPYPGASPAEVEQGVLLAVEEAIRGIDGIDEIRASAKEGSGRISADLLRGTDRERALNDITAAVGRITTFPEDVERPIISLPSGRNEVLTVILHGDLDTDTLQQLAEELRRRFLSRDAVSVVELSGIPQPEIAIEVPREQLREHDLTLEGIADAVRSASVDVPAGGVRTERGEVLLRTTEEREFGWEFRDVTVASRPDGTRIRLGDVAEIRDGYRETGEAAFFDGEPAVSLSIFRVGEQTPMEVAETVRDELEGADLPAKVATHVRNDRSERYQDRVDLLVRNGLFGLILVLALLGLFLQLRLAFWVAMGIVVSFLGAVLFMPSFGVSLNMISLFAFLLALGIVVDDAIVVGEAAHHARSVHDDPLDAAVAGTREVAMPVVFAVLTTIAAFCPLLFLPGTMGQVFADIPFVVIVILLLSLVEVLFILPAHLGHARPRQRGLRYRLAAPQRRFSAWFERAVERFYRPAVAAAVRYRYVTLSASVGLLLVAAGALAGGVVRFNFFPDIEGDEVTASVEMPYGTAIEDTQRAMRRLERAGRKTLEHFGGAEAIGEGIYTELGAVASGGGPGGSRTNAGTHLAKVEVGLVPADERDFDASAFSKRWREEVGPIAGVERLDFDFSIGPSGGTPVSFELRHGDMDVLKRAATEAADALRQYEGVQDVSNGFTRGKTQLDLTLRPLGRAHGVTEAELARQLRNAFFGAEAQRDQRGRNEVRVYVRRPLEERRTLHSVEDFLVRTPEGGEIPLGQVARIERGSSYTEIDRENGGRAVDPYADVDPEVVTPNEVMADVRSTLLPRLLEQYPGLSWEASGQQLQQQRAFSALSTGMTVALLVMYGLMAVVFRSYLQPLAILFAIPFGIVGAIGGHLLMGYDLSLVSVLGMVALSGVVVNDSLVLVAKANDNRRGGTPPLPAVIDAGVRRFRPILLTSLTTFFGLSPMILETSIQARFLVPMAISLGFGVLFVTVIALIIVPAVYLVFEDGKRALAWIYPADEPEPEASEVHG